MTTTWHTPETATAEWRDAPAGETLTQLLLAARHQCEAFAPVLTEPAAIPEEYRIAQLMQARALWQAQRTDPGDTIGIDGQTVRVYPMDWQVKQLLRPAQGRPLLG